MSATVTIRLGAAQKAFVERQVSDGERFEDASDYLNSLIAHDMARTDHEAFERLKLDLREAFASPDGSYVPMSAADVIARSGH